MSTYLQTVTKEGFHFRQAGKGGAFAAPLPSPIEAGAYSESWDPETLTLTYLVPVEPNAEGEPQPPVEGSATFTQAQIDAALAERLTPRVDVPAKVSKAQLKLALLSQGISLSALIDQMPAEQQPVARILVEDATHFERAAAMVGKFAALAGLDDSKVDALFIAAAQIDPAAI